MTIIKANESNFDVSEHENLVKRHFGDLLTYSYSSTSSEVVESKKLHGGMDGREDVGKGAKATKNHSLENIEKLRSTRAGHRLKSRIQDLDTIVTILVSTSD